MLAGLIPVEISVPNRLRRRAFVACLSVLALLPGCGGARTSADAGGVAEVRSHELRSIAGNGVRLADFSGDVVLVDFWATWCTPCHIQADILKELYKEFDVPGVQFLAISVGETEDVVRAFADKRPFPYPVLVDSQEVISGALDVYALPTIMVIDRQGEVTYLRPGISNGETLHRMLLEAGAKSSGSRET